MVRSEMLLSYFPLVLPLTSRRAVLFRNFPFHFLSFHSLNKCIRIAL